MTDNNTPANAIELMIDAKQAAAALRLPYYWFADHAMRTKYARHRGVSHVAVKKAIDTGRITRCSLAI